ncbi:MAG TPA: ABC transporter permease, partial [Parabacteroides sp.]|nr:ABC transporter permease [Parabacteroides sp.]
MNELQKLGYLAKEGIHDMFYIWKEELKGTFKDSGVMIFFFLVPFMYP